MQQLTGILALNYVFSNTFPQATTISQMSSGEKSKSLKEALACNHSDQTQRDLGPLQTSRGGNLVLKKSTTVLH